MMHARVCAFPGVPPEILAALADSIAGDGPRADVTIRPADPQNAIDWALVAVISLWLGDKIAGEFVKQTVSGPIETLRGAIADAYRWVTAYPRPYRSASGAEVNGPAVTLNLPVTVGATPEVSEFICMGGLSDTALSSALAAIADVMQTITAAGALLHGGLQSTLKDPNFYLGPAAPETFLVNQANERWSGFRDAFVGKWIYHPGDARWVRAPS